MHSWARLAVLAAGLTLGSCSKTQDKDAGGRASRAMRDTRPRRHAFEQLHRARILDLVARPIDKGVVDIVIRHGGADGVDMRKDWRQGRLSGAPEAGTAVAETQL